MLTHPTAKSVVSPHNFSWVFIQATVAILILVGFESVTAMGGEAKNPTKHIPIAVIASLLIQGLVCYLIEYFAANYFLNSGYTMQSAAGSAAPIGDMMIIVGDALLGQGHGKYFMMAEAVTVFLALIGTTLSCMNTGARVTYAMGKDDEAPEHFGILHAESLTPRRAIWTLAAISALLGCLAVTLVFADASAPTDATIAALPHGIFSSFGYSTHDKLAALPNSLLTITLTSNFGTFILYALSCFLCIVAFHKRPDHSFVKHTLIPGFGLLANLACMAVYVLGPFFNLGTKMEPLTALGISGVWGLYGAVYFLRSSKAKGKTVLLEAKKGHQLGRRPLHFNQTQTWVEFLLGSNQKAATGNHPVVFARPEFLNSFSYCAWRKNLKITPRTRTCSWGPRVRRPVHVGCRVWSGKRSRQNSDE